MTLEDLLKPPEERARKRDDLYKEYENQDSIHGVEFIKYIQTQGIENITSKDLNKLIEQYGTGIVNIAEFTDYYNIISTNESNKVMKRWTRSIGWMTVVVMISTVLMLWDAISK